MKYMDEYRDAHAVDECASALARITTRPWTIMEVCGGQTHAILKYGLNQLLPPGLELIHGPGCPVCVTPPGLIDQAVELSLRPRTALCTFGDMLRVPGAHSDLSQARASGGDVRTVYSPLDVLALARAEPGREFVFFAVGFETTAPTTAMAVLTAAREGIGNFSLLPAHVRVPPALEAILSTPGARIQGFLAAGHVCAIMGYTEYEPIAHIYQTPIVVTGFEPLDILQGLLLCVQQLEAGTVEVQNQYARCVRREGNSAAQRVIHEIFEPVDREWRGMGTMKQGGFGLKPAYAQYDATVRFELGAAAPAPSSECIAGLVLQGRKRPPECPAFSTRCTPEHPLGAPMVSSEGACAAYYRYRGAQADKATP